MQEKDKKPTIKVPKTIVPAYVAQKCPVCNGYGTVKHGALPCGSCKGTGYVLVPVDPKTPPYPNYRNTMIDETKTWKR